MDAGAEVGKKLSKREKSVQANENKPYAPPPIVEVKPEIDEDGFNADGLTTRQRAFVDALVGPAGGNATRAAEIAGYASDNRNALATTACLTLGKAKVQEAIAHALAARNASPEWAKSQLIDVAGSSLSNFVTVDGEGQAQLDFAKAAAAGALGQLKEFKQESIQVGDSPAAILKTTIKVHDRMPAITTLLKLHGMLVDRHDHTSGGKTIKAFIDVDDADD